VSSITEIREGLIANLEVLNDGGSWIQLSPYVLSDPTPPVIMVLPEEIQYDTALARGGDMAMFTIQALVVANFDVGSQVNLDRMLAGSGPLSVKEAIQADPTLGGKVDDLRVVECTGYQVYNIAGRATLGADWSVQIETSTEEG